MYVNSQFIFYEFDEKEIIINNNDQKYVYEFSLNYYNSSFYLLLNYIFNFYIQKIKKTSFYLSDCFFEFYKKEKIQFKYKVKIRRKKTKKTKKLNIHRHFLLNELSTISLLFWKKRRKWLRIKKVSVSKPMKSILKSRRILKFLFSSFKLKSSKLTKKLLNFFSNKTSKSNLLSFNCLGCLLLRSGIILNLKDVFFFLKTRLIKINNKTTSSFFRNLAAGDIINFSNILFFINYFWYFKVFSNRWLKRKKKRNLFKFRKYVNFNKVTTNVNIIVKRWLSKSRFFLSKFSNFEVDYRILSICLFSKSVSSIKKNLFNSCLQPSGILNTWYYYY